MDIDEWIIRHFPGQKKYKVEIESVLRILAAELRIEATQILPTDSFSIEYALRGVLIDDSLDCAFDQIGEYLKERFGCNLGQRGAPGTVGDLLRDVFDLCRKDESP